MLHSAMGGDETLSGGILWWRVCCGGKLLGYLSVMTNTSADENNLRIFPINKSDGITAMYQEKN